MIYYVGILKQKFEDGENVVLEYVKESHFPEDHFFFVFAALYAIEHNFLKILQYLIELEKFNINAELDEDSSTLLIKAANCNNLEAVKILLLRDDLNVSHQDIHGNSAISYALEIFNEDLAKILLERESMKNH